MSIAPLRRLRLQPLFKSHRRLPSLNVLPISLIQLLLQRLQDLLQPSHLRGSQAGP